MKKTHFIAGSVLASLIVGMIYIYAMFFMIHPAGVSGSDLLTYVGYMNEWYETGSLPDMCQAYPMFYFVLRFIFHFFRNWTVTMLFFGGTWAILSNIVQIAFVKSFLDEKVYLYSILAGSALSFAWPVSFRYSFFGGETFWEILLEQVFLTSGATAPDHSLSFLFVKPFALVCIRLFWQLLVIDEHDWRNAVKCAACFAVALFLSVIAKPNFYQCFAPAGVIAVLAYLVHSGWSVFKRCVLTAIAYLPATVWVLYSMRMKLNPFVVDPLRGINTFRDGVPIPIILIRAIVFCVFVTVCMLVLKRRNRLLILGWLTYLFGTLEYLMLFEPDDPLTLSMGWGYYIGMYVLFATAAIAQRETLVCPVDNRQTVYILGCVMLGLHACAGIAVFIIRWAPFWVAYLQ